MPSREENINSLGAAAQHNYRRAPLVPSRENISSMGTAVQHNFRRTPLVPSRKENINSLGAAVQHNFGRTLLQCPRTGEFGWETKTCGLTRFNHLVMPKLLGASFLVILDCIFHLLCLFMHSEFSTPTHFEA